MKNFILISLLFCCDKAVAQVDSFYKDQRWYYCYQPKSDAVRNFYPKKFDTLIVSKITNDICAPGECKTVYGTGNPWVRNWIDLSNSNAASLKIKPGDELVYDATNVYFNNIKCKIERTNAFGLKLQPPPGLIFYYYKTPVIQKLNR
jgi:hypothetical protein